MIYANRCINCCRREFREYLIKDQSGEGVQWRLHQLHKDGMYYYRYVRKCGAEASSYMKPFELMDDVQKKCVVQL
jgi:hypothetical protein